ncbi:uncharacterized protein Z518_07164 [Rhinocladiella mackenziei CBS 650.93]|uniref:DUF1254 domain-containing protein n=1 Tax=Rhinocladiella mackenziei CBS 650.93 TaxID=1442369 RepID=A0A0D2IK52_9EURO|nr:uncharacterized protein Z518_07164 [Rhinocladiella mackenziei CBS 650.93]KIX03611.1 hypothetical protein Z518_07164 [Rhinocladiella mackenziei CBS 650.93]
MAVNGTAKPEAPQYQIVAEAFGPEHEVQDAMSFAFQYGFPLWSYGKLVQGYPDAKTNTFYHARTLATSEFTSVVRPNNDTLYSIVFLDLSAFDLSVTVPEFGSRFWLFSFYDMYGNNFANIGSVGGQHAGNYLLRFANDSFGLQTQEIAGGYKAYLNCPTAYGILLTRILIANDPVDIQTVHQLQDEKAVSPVPRNIGTIAPPLDLSIFKKVAGDPSSPASLEEQVFQLTAALAPYNQPIVLADRSWVAQMLEKAGIRFGKFTQPPNTSLATVKSSATVSAMALRTTAGLLHPLGNGWVTSSSLISGNYRSFYQARYDTAVRGYLRLCSDQALYPVYFSRPGVPELEIGPKQACLFTFISKPKLNPTGWWSLSLYNCQHFFVQNKLNRYALGDRSELKYPDNISLKDRDNGKFHILIQPDDVEPPASWKDK